MTKPKKTAKKALSPAITPKSLRAQMENFYSLSAADKLAAEERAQELAYDAMEAGSARQQLRLVQQALALDPENVDALLMMADLADHDAETHIETLRMIVDAGAKRLGKKAFKELVPHFWSFIETRPYMRAREQLAETLRAASRLEEAAKEYQEMLTLNEHDNQGIRYSLLPSLLALGRLEEARKLLKRYEDDCTWSVVFSWGNLLERLLTGDPAGANEALAIARKQNPHIEAYLKGERKLPRSMPGSYSPGSEEEALCYAEVLLMAWTRHPQAGVWLAQHPVSCANRFTPNGANP